MAEALPECYHGPLTKEECEDLLGTKNKDGAYLIRQSESIQGALCLCVYKQKVIYTYRILQGHNGNYTLLTAGGMQETYFKTLGDLIRNYKRKNQGLPIHLRHAVKKKTPWLIQPPPRPQRPPILPPVAPGVSSRVPPVSSRVPPVSSRVPPASSRVPPASSRVPPASSRVPPASSRVPPASSRVPPASSRGPPVSSRGPPVSSAGHRSERRQAPAPDEDQDYDNDYENDPSSEYVEVLPDPL